MTTDSSISDNNTDWLFQFSTNREPPIVEGLVYVDSYTPVDHPPEVVSVMEKAQLFGAKAVLFESEQNGRLTPQAFIFSASEGDSDQEFAMLHKRLWSWGGVPLIYRATSGCIQLFRCAHKPDFIKNNNEQLIFNPIRTLKLGTKIAQSELWWDITRLRNGTIWDNKQACDLLLSAHKSAHRKLVEEVRSLSNLLTKKNLLNSSLRRRLLILSLLIAYLEERSILLPTDFEKIKTNAKSFFDILQDGSALIDLLYVLEDRFNGHVFSLTDEERSLLLNSNDLHYYATLINGYTDSNGQLNFWKLYSFKDLPVELISNIYQLFVNDTASSIYTPPALVRLILDETLSWKRLDDLMAGTGIILDPACGSGVFLVEAFKRLILHWRLRNNWKKPNVDTLRLLIQKVHGIDLERGAVELAAFSLCLSLCDALEPEDIYKTHKLFPNLMGNTLHASCFFEAKELGLVKQPISIVIGNPPFISSLSTEGAKRSYHSYSLQHGKLPDKQLAYLFLHDAMEMISSGGILAMIEPSGFIYNQNANQFRNDFLLKWKVREILDFVSIRGLFKKGDADPKIVIVIAESLKPISDDKILHAVFRRNGRAKAEQRFDIDYYDLHWLTNELAIKSNYIWRANLFGGRRFLSFIERLQKYPTLREYVKQNDWDIGEGYIAGLQSKHKPIDHLIGKPLLPTNALTNQGIDNSLITTVPNRTIESPRSVRRFTPPLLLIKESENLQNDLWTDHYLTYKNEIVGISCSTNDINKLQNVKTWLDKESIALQAYVAGISSRLITQRATVIFAGDIFSLPYLENGDLDLSINDKIIAEDIVNYQRDYIRLGLDSILMDQVKEDQLASFDSVFTSLINKIYYKNQLKEIDSHTWSGAICKVYAFGEGKIDWTGSEELHNKIDLLLKEHHGTSLSITRITRIYDQNFIFLLKPDNHRFWTRSIALRDGDDVLADLRLQGF